MLGKLSGLLVFALVLLAATAAWAFDAGDRVLALWEDAYWYPATVEAASGDVLTLHFDDGTRLKVDAQRVKPLAWRPGQQVECRWPHDGKQYPAIILKRDGDMIEVEYVQDGAKAKAHIGTCRESRY